MCSKWRWNQVSKHWWLLETSKQNIKKACNWYTYTEIIDIIIAGFRPMRSAIVPQNKDVKHLPSMYTEPATFCITHTSQINSLHELKTSKKWNARSNLTHITSIKTNISFCFRNIKIPYLKINFKSLRSCAPA